jgi:aspartate aminotransferase
VKLSLRAAGLDESATLADSAKAEQLRRQGLDVVGFGAGEPDFDTPPHIRDAAKRALDAGHTRYAKPASGVLPAKEAVCAKLRRDNGLNYQPDQVIITVGGKEAIPYWVSFIEQIKLCGGVPVVLQPRDGENLLLSPEQFAAALTPRTRMVVFNSPSNPGGFAYSPDQVRLIARALAGRDLVVLSDEMYDRLRYGHDREHLSFANAGSEWPDQTLTINAVSKSYAMTGWRAGYAAGPKPIIQAMAKIQSHTTSGTATFIQHALAEALAGDQSTVETMRRAFEERGRFMHRRLVAMPGVRCCPPTGAFYCFPDVSGCFERLGVKSSAEFCRLALEEVHVALVPGEAFGMATNVRLSFATDMTSITKGLDRIDSLLNRHRP